MRKYATIINDVTKACAVGLGTDAELYKRCGMTEMDVEEGPDGQWYLVGYAPAGPTEAELLAQVKADKVAEFEAAMTATDQALIRPVSDLLDALVSPSTLADDDTEPSADVLAASRAKFLQLRELQIRNRALRVQAMEAKTVDEVQAIQPVTAAALAPDSQGAGGAGGSAGRQPTRSPYDPRLSYAQEKIGKWRA